MIYKLIQFIIRNYHLLTHPKRCNKFSNNTNKFGDIIPFGGFRHRCLGKGVFLQLDRDWGSTEVSTLFMDELFKD